MLIGSLLWLNSKNETQPIEVKPETHTVDQAVSNRLPNFLTWNFLQPVKSFLTRSYFVVLAITKGRPDVQYYKPHLNVIYVFFFSSQDKKTELKPIKKNPKPSSSQLNVSDIKDITRHPGFN